MEMPTTDRLPSADASPPRRPRPARVSGRIERRKSVGPDERSLRAPISPSLVGCYRAGRSPTDANPLRVRARLIGAQRNVVNHKKRSTRSAHFWSTQEFDYAKEYLLGAARLEQTMFRICLRKMLETGRFCQK